MSDQTKPREIECIEWRGPVQPNGYGRIIIKDIPVGVHRIAWALSNGRMPRRGMEICHTCDNRKCINPAHLFEGTKADNMRDMVKKGRANPHNRGVAECKRGHLFSKENTRIRKDGRRECRECMKMHQRTHRLKKAEAQSET